MTIFRSEVPKKKVMTLELDLKFIKRKSNAKFQLNIPKHVWEKCGKLWISSILNFKTGITPTKIEANWKHSNSICSTGKQSHMQNFTSINISKHVWEKCGKLCISSIPSFKRGITPTKIDTNWRHSNLICRTIKQSHVQFQLNKYGYVFAKVPVYPKCDINIKFSKWNYQILLCVFLIGKYWSFEIY